MCVCFLEECIRQKISFFGDYLDYLCVQMSHLALWMLWCSNDGHLVCLFLCLSALSADTAVITENTEPVHSIYPK